MMHPATVTLLCAAILIGCADGVPDVDRPATSQTESAITSTTLRYRYNGKEKDKTDLYYYGARYYDPAIGRFMSTDSILPNAYDPQQLNRYAYVRNNPMRLVDPD